MVKLLKDGDGRKGGRGRREGGRGRRGGSRSLSLISMRQARVERRAGRKEGRGVSWGGEGDRDRNRLKRERERHFVRSSLLLPSPHLPYLFMMMDERYFGSLSERDN